MVKKRVKAKIYFLDFGKGDEETKLKGLTNLSSHKQNQSVDQMLKFPHHKNTQANSPRRVVFADKKVCITKTTEYCSEEAILHKLHRGRKQAFSSDRNVLIVKVVRKLIERQTKEKQRQQKKIEVGTQLFA
ncbi:hypothetical protein P5673_021066 [Acropora cervicornis]|uniref:Uncharacterized protein n=1 Tax=Acropora cervicornis TaxID=6130 RepID=A0AAD9Q9M4_ACRCE|nr:hypothetical protein P5673_021066 [Acropora cervicornis]